MKVNQNNMKKKLKICIGVTIDTSVPGIPEDLIEKLSSVRNILTDTNEFYLKTNYYLTSVLYPELLSQFKEQKMKSPEGPFEILNIINMESESESDSSPDLSGAIIYNSVTKDVDEDPD
jgi:hypothetical protein